MSVVDVMSQPSCHAGRAAGGLSIYSPSTASSPPSMTFHKSTAASLPPHDAAKVCEARNPTPKQCDEWPK